MYRRALITAAAFLATTTAVKAAQSDDVLDALAKCTEVADRDARFNCYERLAPQIRAIAQKPTSESQPVENHPPAITVYQPMGGEILPLQIGVASYTVAPSGSFTVTLDNGQVWREHDRDFDTPGFAKDGKNIVVIQRGLLGGYDLHIKGTSTFFKVVRVQ
jgi:hypothetical protein